MQHDLYSRHGENIVVVVNMSEVQPALCGLRERLVAERTHEPPMKA